MHGKIANQCTGRGHRGHLCFSGLSFKILERGQIVQGFMGPDKVVLYEPAGEAVVKLTKLRKDAAADPQLSLALPAWLALNLSLPSLKLKYGELSQVPSASLIACAHPGHSGGLNEKQSLVLYLELALSDRCPGKECRIDVRASAGQRPGQDSGVYQIDNFGDSNPWTAVQ